MWLLQNLLPTTVQVLRREMNGNKKILNGLFLFCEGWEGVEGMKAGPDLFLDSSAIRVSSRYKTT